ncbi:MAG: putative Ig domain-containing protein, partial [Candidatus Omnitrophica bacterium]|nr:putative Ig domain-containing protein [Candidatus Omnitrophota bacterium]
TDPDDQRNPAISGNRIVWQDYRNGNADIYLYDLASGSETPLITDPVGGISPAISGRHVAFAKGTDIGLVRWPSSVAWQLTLDSASQQFPSVDGNRVVWEDDRNGNLDIYMTTLPNRAPLLAPIGGQSVNEGDLLTFEVVGGDPEGMPASYAASNLPSGAAFGPSTPWFSWVPAFEQAGSYAVTFTVSDGVLQASETITITVTNTNRAPSLTVPGSQTVAESQSLTFSVSATDPDGDALTYGATNLPAGASFSTATQTFAWTPSCSQGGTSYAVTFTASDGALQASQAVAITVTDVPTCGSGGGRRRKPVLREAL